jgi:hypothetical protein
LECYHDFMSFRRRRYFFSYVFFLQRPSLYLFSAPERRMATALIILFGSFFKFIYGMYRLI